MAENSSVWCGVLEAAQHPLDLGHEAHVGHAVRLVEHEGLELVDGDLTAVTEVDEPPGRGDDDVDTLAELGDLAIDVGPAVDGDGAQPDGAGQRHDHVVHLHGELAGREQHEGQRPGRPAGRLAVALRFAGRLGPLEQRHPEGQGLARTGLGLAADVAAGQRVGDGQRLNWKSADDSFIGQRFGEFLGDAEGLERPRRLVGVVPLDVSVRGGSGVRAGYGFN